MLHGDLKPEPQNQLELKVNASIHLTTKANASLEITRGIHPFSMVIDSFPFFWFENGIITSQKQNNVKNCWEKQQKLANFMKKGTLKTNKHIQNALIASLMKLCPSFGHELNCQVKHYFPANFLCRVIKGWLSTALGLISRLSRSFSLPP